MSSCGCCCRDGRSRVIVGAVWFGPANGEGGREAGVGISELEIDALSEASSKGLLTAGASLGVRTAPKISVEFCNTCVNKRFKLICEVT